MQTLSRAFQVWTFISPSLEASQHHMLTCLPAFLVTFSLQPLSLVCRLPLPPLIVLHLKLHEGKTATVCTQQCYICIALSASTRSEHATIHTQNGAQLLSNAAALECGSPGTNRAWALGCVCLVPTCLHAKQRQRANTETGRKTMEITHTLG